MKNNPTNQDIIYKLGGIEANVAAMQEDIRQIKKDTRFFPIVKGIVFGMVIVILLGAMAVINQVIFHQPIGTGSLPPVAVQTPGR